ncbi:helix-turn-helix domain-containing protein [Streptomyces sp. NPDC059785]|uniref:helix-turn-helix domain-containing protein n=1 Tax=Streptomyces sp. NPDC059785 TaxID=3346945 RepID=UPI003662A0A2
MALLLATSGGRRTGRQGGGDDGQDGRPATVRRAVAFIDEHAPRDLSVADIAEAAHVSIRTLQCAFRRHLDTTPMNHLRRVRLAHAHADLLAADPASGVTVTVTAIATRWASSSPAGSPPPTAPSTAGPRTRPSSTAAAELR